jgi:segregation and condensation protein B
MTTNNLSLKHIIEAAIFAYEEPLSVQKLAELFDEAERPSTAELNAALQALQQDYAERGIELKQVASGYRFQARQDSAQWLKKLWAERPSKYSRSFLETLSLIAYRQPITRAEIEEVRGVAVNPNVIRSLIERNWVKIVGHRDVPGKPELLGTSKEFLDYFNLKNLSELPPLQEIKNLDITGSEAEMHLQLLQQAETERV